jgi:hypothetical protein
MLPKSLIGFCCASIHALALACASISVYFFFDASIEYMVGAVILLGAAVAIEVVATILGDSNTAHT